MAASFESQSWYRVAHLKTRLADRVEVSRQFFRQNLWYVLRDPTTGKFARLSDSAYWMVAQMDGERTLGEVWDMACAELGDSAPPQDELLATVSQLSSLDLLASDGLPDVHRLAERGERSSAKRLLQRFLNPLALRFPIFDPDPLLTELWPLARPLFTVWGGLAYIALILWAAITAGRNWEELTTNAVDKILSAESLLILVLVYPFVKLIHELGHGFAIKKWGGEVREVGLMFLVFIPVPYVDGSASTGFASKWARMLVAGAGILVEMGLAAIAMLLWAELEPGFWRAVCFNIMVIGGVSTLLFNGNPLLRFDGYFVLSDWLEIPNLGMRANRYLGYLVQRYLFGMPGARSPVRARGEAPWFFFYAILAFCYRILISITIILIVAARFFVVGILLAIWSVTLMFLLPLAKHIRFVLAGEGLRGRRARAVTVSLGLVALVVGGLGLMPVPYRTLAEGVVYAPEEATVFAAEAGEVEAVYAAPNTEVGRAAPILRLTDPFAETRLQAIEADAEKFRLRYEQSLSEGAYETRLWEAQAARAESEAEILRRRLAALEITAPRDGIFVVPRPADLPGRFLQRGDVVGFVVQPEDLMVRVAVPQDLADLVRRRGYQIELRPASAPERRMRGALVREVPSVGYELPSLALSSEGGGRFALDPAAPQEAGPRSLEPLMLFDVVSVDEPLNLALGMRIHVRFDHGAEPVASRIYRRVRQVFLKRLNV